MKSRRSFIQKIGSTAASVAIGTNAFANSKEIKSNLLLQDLNVNLDTSLNYQSAEFQSFLFDDFKNQLIINPSLSSGFTNVQTDRRDGTESPYLDEAILLVNEKWGVYEDSGLSGINNITVVYKSKFNVKLRYWLSFNSTIDEQNKNICRKLFLSYTPGTNIIDFINTNLPANIDKSGFSIDTEVQIEKTKKIEFDIRQRETLINIYNGSAKSTLHLIDGSLGTWQNENKTRLVHLLPDELESKTEPQIAREIVVVMKPQTADSNIGSVVDSLLSFVVPTECDSMRKEQIKLLTVAEWPEFKVVWNSRRIKIGCSTITIYYPTLQVRMSKIVVFIYFSLPNNLGQTVFQIAKTCAIRSALGAAILGVILSNPGVAIASFQVLFKACVENEIKSCLNSGLATIKETSDWS